MMEATIQAALGIFYFFCGFTVLYVVIYNIHERSQRLMRLRLEADYEREADYQRARQEAKEMEQRQDILKETNREYMEAMRAEEIIRELEKGNIK